MQVVLAEPRGFCAGVVLAIEIVERALEKFGAPAYVRHEIVHSTDEMWDAAVALGDQRVISGRCLHGLQRDDNVSGTDSAVGPEGDRCLRKSFEHPDHVCREDAHHRASRSIE